MEIVKKEIVEKVESFNYFGFLCYLLDCDEHVRTILLDRLLAFHDLEKTEISNEEHFEDNRTVLYDLKTIERDGYEEEFDFYINDIFEDLVLFLSLKTKKKSCTHEIEYKIQYNLCIVCDSKDEIFDRYIVKDSDLKKIVYLNRKNLQISDQNVLEFHMAVQLDCVDEVVIKDDFDHLMYLLKHNKPYDDNHPIYKEVVKIHEEYLKSEFYTQAFEYELERVRKMVKES
ncbi:MAG: hypothetical protein U0L85_11930 [Bacilli bacterium]|nr:hypothetical protein [Bacilli bacterium]